MYRIASIVKQKPYCLGYMSTEEDTSAKVYRRRFSLQDSLIFPQSTYPTIQSPSPASPHRRYSEGFYMDRGSNHDDKHQVQKADELVSSSVVFMQVGRDVWMLTWWTL
ncbi:uncharacterized protein QC761_116960 [Podospora bellae-mahoneyi]|uniref:Uncharacterized protein n=1 Tax=Podospora bellae-mahoneyi TaxID=2093777 RepID=A0ABR0G0H0_9PEZI|nr:hypothetical protein QC761_116960 [Podospora bellae-mahoneyi]